MNKALIFLVLSAAWASVAAHAQSSGGSLTITDIQAAQLLIVNQRYDDAKKLLDHVLAEKPDDSETLFLLAAFATAQKDYDTAINDYRHILVQEPNAERVRLELARTFFLQGDYDNAERQFRFARAGDVPDAVKANIDTFLGAINRLRQWQVSASLALAPDTNENTGTSASQINIFGLPFALDPNARRQSGIGAAGDISGEWSPLVSDNVKARIGGDLTRLDYSGGSFDDMTLSGYAGPQFLFSNWDFSVLATGFDRWYGNRPFLNGGGGKLAVDYGITSNLVIGASVGGQDIFDKLIPLQTGPLYSFQSQATYALSPSSLVQLLGGVNRQLAEIAPYSYAGGWIGAGYQQDLPWGFSAGIQPTYYHDSYDAQLPAFGVTRHDNSLALGVSALNRRLSYHGFTPRFSYIFTDQRSNIALYGFTRSQFQLGLTTLF